MGGRNRQISEFKASLVYRVSFRTARATQRNPVSKNNIKWARKMTQWLRALIALPEVLNSVPSNHMVAHNHL